MNAWSYVHADEFSLFHAAGRRAVLREWDSAPPLRIGARTREKHRSLALVLRELRRAFELDAGSLEAPELREEVPPNRG